MPPFFLPGLRVLLADVGQRRSPVIRLELIRLRCQLVDVLDLETQAQALEDALDRLKPQLLLIDCQEPTPELLAQIAAIQARQPLAVLLAADRAEPDLLRAALQSNVSLLELSGLPPQRLGAILQLTLARFEHDREWQLDLERTRAQLSERKDIERAKGILMREQGLDEDEAYQRLRRLAMDAGQTLSSVAERLIDAQALLRP